MAQPTLYEALYSFHSQWKEALENNSKRTVERLERDWQTINNNWDLYFQALAEGNEDGADLAIGEIVTLLNGDIDISVVPTVEGIATERDGVESVTAVETKITFVSDIGVDDYRLLVNLHDSGGNPIDYELGLQETDGFTITPSAIGTLVYNAKIFS